MKRCINIGHQAKINEEGSKEFGFFCTVKDRFEIINGNCLWESVEEFTRDYQATGGDQINRYLVLIPKTFR
jgi:hypothetical protein